MVATTQQKEQIKRDLAACLSREREVRKVIIFGSFLTSETPNDLDVAIFSAKNGEMIRNLTKGFTNSPDRGPIGQRLSQADPCRDHII